MAFKALVTYGTQVMKNQGNHSSKKVAIHTTNMDTINVVNPQTSLNISPKLQWKFNELSMIMIEALERLQANGLLDP